MTVHPLLGPTIARPTRLLPSSSHTKTPIPLSLLDNEKLNLPPQPSRSASISKASPSTPTSTRLVSKVVAHSQQLLQTNPPRAKSILLSKSPWPANLRVLDGWSGFGRWGEGSPDRTEWYGVEKKHKDLVKEKLHIPSLFFPLHYDQLIVYFLHGVFRCEA